MDDPRYLVGRKGAGKTAFLAGAPLLDGSDVVSLKSEHIYSEVERLRSRYQTAIGPLYADTLVYVWEVLLFHAAMLGICRSNKLAMTADRQCVWTYLATYGDPATLATDELLAAVSARMSESLARPASGVSFRSACQQLEAGGISYLVARTAVYTILDGGKLKSRLFVVVDNLEELHQELDHLRETIAALFRLSTKDRTAPIGDRLPFSTRFAFPAELLLQLRLLTVNPEKDFDNHLVIKWSAAELIALAGNRVRLFLDAWFPGQSHKQLGLPREHDPGDREASEKTLRALLPNRPVQGGLGCEEDPIAYVMRHTQLLPRHLILNLNAIFSRVFMRLSSGDQIARATEIDVLEGIHEAEHTIVEGIFSSYHYRYPDVADALGALKNHLPTNRFATSELHTAFNRSGARARAGLAYRAFLEGALAVGALGIVTDPPTERYIRGEFAYTFREDLRPVEDRDDLCVHPLFMYRFFDRRTISRLALEGTRPVYPYGSDPDDD